MRRSRGHRVLAQELGDGRMHTCEAVPSVLAGSGGGFFTTGRKVDLTGVTHDAVLVSIAHVRASHHDHGRRHVGPRGVLR